METVAQSKPQATRSIAKHSRQSPTFSAFRLPKPLHQKPLTQHQCLTRGKGAISGYSLGIADGIPPHSLALCKSAFRAAGKSSDLYFSPPNRHGWLSLSRLGVLAWWRRVPSLLGLPGVVPALPGGGCACPVVPGALCLSAGCPGGVGVPGGGRLLPALVKDKRDRKRTRFEKIFFRILRGSCGVFLPGWYLYRGGVFCAPAASYGHLRQ